MSDDEFSDLPAGASPTGFRILEPIGEGPFELPRCKDVVTVLTEDDHFLLRVELEETGQAVFVPLPYEAATDLAVLANHLMTSNPSGETQH